MDKENALDLLKEEMENDDVKYFYLNPHPQIQIKVNAIHRLPIVMANMSSDKIISELIPYLLSKNFITNNI
jgi:hypothetical protein